MIRQISPRVLVATAAAGVTVLAAVAAHVLAALRSVGPPADGEARLAAAVFAARDGRPAPLPPVDLPWPDLLAARQLAAVASLTGAFTPGGSTGSAVWDGVRAAALALGLVTALLLAAVLRRLGCAGPPVVLAVAAVGVAPPALALHGAVTAAAMAVPWLLGAALLCWRGGARNRWLGRVLGGAAAVAAALATLTAPVVGAALLAATAHLVAVRGAAARTTGGPRSPRRLVPAAVLGVAAVGLAAASAGSGPLAGAAAPVISTPVALAGVACGLGAVAAAWSVRWARPLLGPTVLVLAVLLVPGPGRAAAALLGLVLAVAVAALAVDDRAVRWPGRAPRIAAVTGLAAAAVAAAVVVPPGHSPASPDPVATLIAWAREQDPGPYGAHGPKPDRSAPDRSAPDRSAPDGVVPDGVAPGGVAPDGVAPDGPGLHASPLDGAELVAAGFPPARLRDLGAPPADGDLVVVADRPGAPPAPVCAGAPLLALPRLGGAPAVVCAARAPAPDADRAPRVRLGTALADSPRLRLDPAAATLLRRGDVDARVLVLLAGLAEAHTVTVRDFPAGPLEPPDAVRRRVLVGAVDGQPAGAAADDRGGDDRAAASPLRAWFAGQTPPYVPAVLRDDRGALIVGYRDPAPPGLLPAS